MKASLVRLTLLLCLGSVGGLAQEIRLTLSRTTGSVQIRFATEPGNHYDLETSADLASWGASALSKAGDGREAVHEVPLPGADRQFFRLKVQESTNGLAPAVAEMTALLVGARWQDYDFNETNRFDWNGEAGDWTYEKTGPDTGRLVFTYDEDGNDPAIYREEVQLTFLTLTSVRYRYSEFNGGTEDPGSVWSATTDLAFLFHFAPAPAEMSARLVGRTWEEYVFHSATRFEWPGDPGNWTYEKTDRNTGLLVFTYDSDANDPAVYREQMRLTFNSPISGTYRWSEYRNNREYLPSVIYSAPFTLPPLPSP